MPWATRQHGATSLKYYKPWPLLLVLVLIFPLLFLIFVKIPGSGIENFRSNFVQNSKKSVCLSLLSTGQEIKKEISQRARKKPMLVTQNNLQYCMIRKNGSTAWLKLFYRLIYGNLSNFSR